MQKAPFVIIADFETFNVKCDDIEDVFDFQFDHNFDPVEAGCEIKTNHEESGFSFYSVSDYFGTNFKRYRGKILHSEDTTLAMLCSCLYLLAYYF